MFEAILLLLLLVVVVVAVAWRRLRTKPPCLPRTHKASVLVVLGSGGHTAEMLALVSGMDCSKYARVTWVVADTDTTSLPRLEREAKLGGLLLCSEQHFVVIPRSREVNQPWLSTLYSTAKASAFAIRQVGRIEPDLILLNGPGTGVPILLGALWLRIVRRSPPPRLVFVESFCRVHSLSLTGRICYPVVDRFIVQWPALQHKYPRAEYLGVIF